MERRFGGVLLVILCLSFLAVDSADAVGKRRPKDPGGPTAPTPQIISETRYIGPYFEIDSTGQTKHHIFLGDERLGILNDKQDLYFVISDHLGSSSILTTSTGTVAEMTDYSPFGSQSVDQTVVATGNQYAFAGKEVDPESSLQYFGARYLSNDLARFNSTDPLLGDPARMSGLLPDPQQLNSYAYGRNNPLSFFDPTGEKVELVTRPVETFPLGSHAFVLITNSQEDAANLKDIPSISDKTRLTFGGYIGGNFLTGDLIKQINNEHDFTLPEQQYVTRTEVEKPERYSTQTEFENAVIQSYLNLPGRFGAYDPLGHPINSRQANSNNVASTVLLNAGINRETIMSGMTQSQAVLTPGIGNRPPAQQAISARTQWGIAKYLVQRLVNAVRQGIR